MWSWINQHDMSMDWDKEKIPSPQQESNPWPLKHRAGALSTNLREHVMVTLFHVHFVSTTSFHQIVTSFQR